MSLCCSISWFWKWSVMCVQTVGPYNLTLSRPATMRADRPWWEQTGHDESRPAVMRAAAMEEEERRDWRGSFLADSDDEQDGAEPANGPWNSTTIPRYRRRISHDIMIQKIPTIRALKFCSWAAHHCLWLCSGYFRGVCTPLTEVSGRVGLRSAHCGDLYVPTTRSELGKRSFCVAAARIWNSLPLRLHSFTISRERFRARLKTHLFMCTYTWLASENYWGVYLLTYLLTEWFACRCTKCTDSEYPCKWCIRHHVCTNHATSSETCEDDIMVTGRQVCVPCHVSLHLFGIYTLLAKATSYVQVDVLCFYFCFISFFLSMRLLSNSWMDFRQMFTPTDVFMVLFVKG